MQVASRNMAWRSRRGVARIWFPSNAHDVPMCCLDAADVADSLAAPVAWTAFDGSPF